MILICWLGAISLFACAPYIGAWLNARAVVKTQAMLADTNLACWSLHHCFWRIQNDWAWATRAQQELRRRDASLYASVERGDGVPDLWSQSVAGES